MLVISNQDNSKIPSFRATGHGACNTEHDVGFDYCLEIDDVIIN